MTTNTVRARLSRSFKGDTYNLDAGIDLDRHIGTLGEDGEWATLTEDPK